VGSYVFSSPPPDTRAYVTGLCSKPFGDCEFDGYYTRRKLKRRRLTREATHSYCGCGAPLTDVQPIKPKET
jgi:hypothetical protein